MNFWNKIIIKRIIKLTPLYFKIKNSFLHEEEIYDEIKIINKINKIIKIIPYYRDRDLYYNNKIQKITDFPLLDKTDIIGKEEDFISKKINKKSLIKVSTGGTSGKSLNFYKTVSDIIKEEAFISHSLSLIGNDLKIGVLRGNKPSKGIFEYKFGCLLLSSYDLSKENVKKYVELIKKYEINCLHVYPTSIHIFCKYLIELKESIDLPNLKGILSSSEILTKEDKSLILELFPKITLIDHYGQNEHVAFALSINMGFYKFFKNYSYVEFHDFGETKDQNRIAEIVGTNIFNHAMPLLRYKTEDFVEIDNNGNICSIIGRTQDFIINKRNNIVPCIVVTRNNTLQNVITFQYYQEKIGELIYRVLVNNKFSNIDEKAILEDMNNCFNGLIDVKVELVTHFEKTKAGKQKRLIQKLDIEKIKHLT